MASIYFYNTLTRKKALFEPLQEGSVSLYSCGPTVYWFAHIGNMRAYLFSDVLRRVLEYNNFQVKQVVNITDVGHLTDEADGGEDRMTVAMRREGKSAYEIAEFYTQVFFRDLKELNILSAHEYPRATGHIEEQISLIQKIVDQGYTYQISDGIYFDTSKLHEYGRLSGQATHEKLAGARIEVGQKRHASDFALWKFSKEGSTRQMEWNSPWAKGFPGWHIECSAMSMKYLGAPFDIHTGGIDHIAVHHENELAQTYAALGVLEANVWMHHEHVLVDGKKMSKSLGNIYTLDDVAARGFEPLTLRYFYSTAHYRTNMNFTWEALGAAQNALKKLQTIFIELPSGARGNQEKGGYEEKFLERINDDLDIPGALAVVWTMLKDEKISPEITRALLLQFDSVLGFGLENMQKQSIPDEIIKLVQKREEVRRKKDFMTSDLLRDEIFQKGYIIKDTDQGPLISHQ